MSVYPATVDGEKRLPSKTVILFYGCLPVVGHPRRRGCLKLGAELGIHPELRNTSVASTSEQDRSEA